MSLVDQRERLAAVAEGRDNRHGGMRVTFDAKGKLQLPEVPAHDDQVGHCSWLSAVFNLDADHRITGGVREGLRGPDGHVVLTRVGAAPIRFEPAASINNPTRLIEKLSWQKLPTDGPCHALRAEHCRHISHVVVMLCGTHETISDAQEAEGVVSDVLSAGEPVEGRTTYGTSGQRYEAAVALRRAADELTGRKVGPCRYLIDANTGELVIAVSDLQEAARRHVGSSLPHGWVDGRMATLGWARITLDGHEQSGRSGRSGPHTRIFAYRGLLPAANDGQEHDHPATVTT